MVIGLLGWPGGAMSAVSLHDALPILAISGGGTEILDGRTLDNSGSAAWGGQNNNIYLQNGAAWNNNPSAELYTPADYQHSIPAGAATESFSNQGTFEKSAGGSTTVNV